MQPFLARAARQNLFARARGAIYIFLYAWLRGSSGD